MKTIFDIFRNIAVTTLKVTALSIIISFMATSCSDDVDYDHSFAGIEGEPTMLSLNVEVTDAKQLSRAASETYIENLWIGIYNEKTGVRTFGKEYTENKDAGTHVFQKISGIECKSGYSYIVAVANYSEQYGVDIDDKMKNH